MITLHDAGKPAFKVLSFHPASDWFCALVLDDGTVVFDRIAGWVLAETIATDATAGMGTLVGVGPPVRDDYQFDVDLAFREQFLGYVHERDLDNERALFEERARERIQGRGK